MLKFEDGNYLASDQGMIILDAILRLCPLPDKSDSSDLGALFIEGSLGLLGSYVFHSLLYDAAAPLCAPTPAAQSPHFSCGLKLRFRRPSSELCFFLAILRPRWLLIHSCCKIIWVANATMAVPPTFASIQSTASALAFELSLFGIKHLCDLLKYQTLFVFLFICKVSCVWSWSKFLCDILKYPTLAVFIFIVVDLG